MKYGKIIIAIIVVLLGILFFGKDILNKSSFKKEDLNKNEELTQLLNPPKGSIKATVNRDVDGDTVIVTTESGQKMDVRLLLVDTPETKHPNMGVQKYGKEASEFTSSYLKKGQVVYLEQDVEKKDKYNRDLAYIWFKDNGKWIMINEALVANGLARVAYVYESKKYLPKLEALQNKAKEEKLNIWSKPGYVTNRGFNMNVYN